MIIVFAVVSPFLIQNVLGYTAIQYGNVMLLSGVAWFIGSMASRLLIHIAYEVKAQYCLWMMLAVAVMTLLIENFVTLNIYIIVIPVTLLMASGGIFRYFIKIKPAFTANFDVHSDGDAVSVCLLRAQPRMHKIDCFWQENR